MSNILITGYMVRYGSKKISNMIYHKTTRFTVILVKHNLGAHVPFRYSPTQKGYKCLDPTLVDSIGVWISCSLKINLFSNLLFRRRIIWILKKIGKTIIPCMCSLLFRNNHFVPIKHFLSQIPFLNTRLLT